MNKEKKTLEQLQAEEEKAKQDLKVTKQDLRIIQYKKSKMTRNQRTHHLCARGGELNKYLIEPDLLTDEDVFDILKEIFLFPRIRDIVKDKVRQARERITN